MKNLLNLKGVKKMSKIEQQSVNGGGSCNSECYCLVCKTTVSGCVVCWDHHE